MRHVDHEAVGKSILELVHNGASYQMIGNYLANIYKEEKQDNCRELNYVDRQGSSFSQEEIDDRHQGNG
jgi:uncharacterized Ntn-hydrolase superfamily protein